MLAEIGDRGNPGSYNAYIDEHELPDSSEAVELYGAALDAYRQHLAENGGVTPEELHSGLAEL